MDDGTWNPPDFGITDPPPGYYNKVGFEPVSQLDEDELVAMAVGYIESKNTPRWVIEGFIREAREATFG